MTKHRVIVRTRALSLTLQAEFDSAALAESWARRLHQAHVSGSAISIGNVRVPGSEIVRVERGPVGGRMLALGAVDPETGVASDDDTRTLKLVER